MLKKYQSFYKLWWEGYLSIVQNSQAECEDMDKSKYLNVLKLIHYSRRHYRHSLQRK